MLRFLILFSGAVPAQGSGKVRSLLRRSRIRVGEKKIDCSRERGPGLFFGDQAVRAEKYILIKVAGEGGKGVKRGRRGKDARGDEDIVSGCRDLFTMTGLVEDWAGQK